ncbi:MAG: hypothetical protein LUC83_07620 [Clostridiales bacterium]|nr:hypothetical protein [Clostridiales bacterium]
MNSNMEVSMSFSGDIKNELARCFPDEYHCLLAELAAIIHYAGSLSGNADHGVILVETENVALAKNISACSGELLIFR